MDEKVPLTPPIPPLDPPVAPKPIQAPPVFTGFKKSKIIKIIAILFIIFSLPRMIYMLFSLSNFSVRYGGMSYYDLLLSFPVIYFLSALITLFTKNRTVYNIAKIVMILGFVSSFFFQNFMNMMSF